MRPIPSRSLPVQGYPGGALSETRADAFRKNADALALVMREHSDNAFRIWAAFERFRCDLTHMGLRDCATDLFTNGAQKRLILDALARCHIASNPLGRRHLRGLGEYPLQTGASSLYLLQKLPLDIRQAMIGPSSDTPIKQRPEVFSCGLITVGIPGADLRLPLMPECFGAGEGAISAREYETLMDGAHTAGSSIRDWLAVTYRSLDCNELDSLARTHEKDACAYAAAGYVEIAAERYVRAIRAFADADRQTAVLRCLAASREVFAATQAGANVVTACAQYAEACEKDGRTSRAAEVRLKVNEFRAYVDKYGPVPGGGSSAGDGVAGSTMQQQRSNGVLWRAFESEIAAKLIPLKTTGIRTPMGTIYFKFERDCVSFEKFEQGKRVRWCLLRRDDYGEGIDAVYDLITEETANRLTRENLHPQREEGLRDGDIVRGVDMLRALLPLEPLEPMEPTVPMGRDDTASLASPHAGASTTSDIVSP